MVCIGPGLVMSVLHLVLRWLGSLHLWGLAEGRDRVELEDRSLVAVAEVARTLRIVAGRCVVAGLWERRQRSRLGSIVMRCRWS